MKQNIFLLIILLAGLLFTIVSFAVSVPPFHKNLVIWQNSDSVESKDQHYYS